MSNVSRSKIKISHNTQLYPICIIGAGLTGQSLAYLLKNANNKKTQNFCIIDIRPHLTYASPYISTGFIQNKTLKLLNKFFTQKPQQNTKTMHKSHKTLHTDLYTALRTSLPITNKITKLYIFGQYIKKPIHLEFNKPFGYMLDINRFLEDLNVQNISTQQKAKIQTNTKTQSSAKTQTNATIYQNINATNNTNARANANANADTNANTNANANLSQNPTILTNHILTQLEVLEKTKQPEKQKFKLIVKDRKTNTTKTLITKKIIVADGTISNTSKMLYKNGFKVNINKKFIQGAETIIQITNPKLAKKFYKQLKNQIFFGIFPEYYGYGMWIAPFFQHQSKKQQKNISHTNNSNQYNNIYLKIGFALDHKQLLKRKINLNKLMQLTLQRAQELLNFTQNDYKIIHTGFKLIPLITAAQLHNISVYENIWQIGDAGGFVGSLLLDGIYPGINSAVDTFKDLTSPTPIMKKAPKTVFWSAKHTIPGNSVYTVQLMKYLTVSAVLKEFYDLIFTNKILFYLASKLIQLTGKKALTLFFKYKKEI